MSWRSGDDEPRDAWRSLGGAGGDWRGLRPSLDNPMTWSLTIGRVSGIAVRLHVIFLLFITVEMLRAVFTSDTALGPEFAAIWIGSLFVIVLCHEFGHCIACRWVGGTADEILMWPLGGLAYCRPGDDWKSHFITVIGGPAVNVIFFVVTGLLLGLLTGQWLGVALPNPLHMEIFKYDLDRSWGLLTLFLFHWTNLLLLLFNLLLPMFPMDGGRIVQSLLWAKIGYVRSMRIALRIGYGGAIVLGVFGWVSGQWLLVGIAIFGGITCYLTHKQMEYTESVMSIEGDGWIPNMSDDDEDEVAVEKPSRREDRRRQREAEESAEVDRILEKIAQSGMDGITGKERRLLERVSERKRAEGNA